ncbi:MAG TPA: DNA polymerase III subunit delta', partial [Xylella sp.]
EAFALEALDAARGHPGLAMQWLRDDGMMLRRAVATGLEMVARGQIGVVELAQQWVADGNTEQRLHHAADLALTRAATVLTDPSRLHKLVIWFDAANRTRDLLRTTVRADVAVIELLLAWRTGWECQAECKEHE